MKESERARERERKREGKDSWVHRVQLLLFLDSCICLCLLAPLRRFTRLWSSSLRASRRITWHIFFVVRVIYTFSGRLAPFQGPGPDLHSWPYVRRITGTRVITSFAFRDTCNIRNIFMNISADHTVHGHSVLGYMF